MVDQYGSAYLNVAEIATVATSSLKTGDFVVVASSTSPTLSKITIKNFVDMVTP
jgi:hypothetical protein